MRKYFYILVILFISVSVFADDPDTRIIDDSPDAYNRTDRVHSNHFFTNSYNQLVKSVNGKEDKNYLRGKPVDEPKKDKYVYYDGTKHIYKEASGSGGIKKLQGCDKEEIWLKHTDSDISTTFKNFEFFWHEGTGNIYLRVPVISEMNSLVKYGVISHDDFVTCLDKYTKNEAEEKFAHKTDFNKAKERISANESNIAGNSQKILDNISEIDNTKKSVTAVDVKVNKNKTDIAQNKADIKLKQNSLNFNDKDDYYLNGKNEFKQIESGGIKSLKGQEGKTLTASEQNIKIEMNSALEWARVYSDERTNTHIIQVPDALTKGFGWVSHVWVERVSKYKYLLPEHLKVNPPLKKEIKDMDVTLSVNIKPNITDIYFTKPVDIDWSSMYCKAPYISWDNKISFPDNIVGVAGGYNNTYLLSQSNDDLTHPRTYKLNTDTLKFDLIVDRQLQSVKYDKLKMIHNALYYPSVRISGVITTLVDREYKKLTIYDEHGRLLTYSVLDMCEYEDTGLFLILYGKGSTDNKSYMNLGVFEFKKNQFYLKYKIQQDVVGDYPEHFRNYFQLKRIAKEFYGATFLTKDNNYKLILFRITSDRIWELGQTTQITPIHFAPFYDGLIYSSTSDFVYVNIAFTEQAKINNSNFTICDMCPDMEGVIVYNGTKTMHISVKDKKLLSRIEEGGGFFAFSSILNHYGKAGLCFMNKTISYINPMFNDIVACKNNEADFKL